MERVAADVTVRTNHDASIAELRYRASIGWRRLLFCGACLRKDLVGRKVTLSTASLTQLVVVAVDGVASAGCFYVRYV